MRWLILASLFLSAPAFGFNARQCAQNVWMKKGLFRQYDVKYSTIEFISFKTSSDEGSMKVSSASSTQGSTMASDPGISTGQTQSYTQFSSSFGDCSMWASDDRWMKREFYVAENIGHLRADIAKGDGEYLDSLAYLSGCSASAKARFAAILHNNYSSLFSSENYWGLASDVDGLMQNDGTLSKECNVFPTGV